MHVKQILTNLLGIIFSVIGLVKLAGGAVLPDIYNMERHAIGDRAQPVFATFLPEPNIAPKFREMPVENLLIAMGLIELCFGSTMLLLSFYPPMGKLLGAFPETFNLIMLMYMMFQLMPYLSRVNQPGSVSVPTAFQMLWPAVLSSLVLARSLMSPIKTRIKLK